MDSHYPSNTRQIAEGYLLGSEPDSDELVSLHDHGIKVIVSLANISYSANKQLNTLGFDHFKMKLNHTFYVSDSIDDLLSVYNPSEIYIHCKHGSDRTGVMTAYILIKYHGWNTSNALLSVLSKNHVDLTALLRIFDSCGIRYTQEQINKYWGINATPNGGLKAHTDDYAELIRSMIDLVSTC